MMRRLDKAREIAEGGRIKREGDLWLVGSQSKVDRSYTVNPRQGTCTCLDFEFWEAPCKHVYAVRLYQSLQHTGSIPHEKSKPMPTYSQDWSAYNAAQINEKEHFQLLLRELCDGIADIPRERGAPGRPRLPLGDMVFACTMKVYTTVSGRRASTDVRNCETAGYLRKAPHHNSISNYLLMPLLTPLLKELIAQSAEPLSEVEDQFAVDSTGFGTTTYDRWQDYKPGEPTQNRHRWIKAHAMVGVKTNIVTSIKVTHGHVADVTQLPDLLSASAKNFDIKEVSADAAYLSNRNINAIEALGAVPYIDFKKNSRRGTQPGWQRMYHMFWQHRDEFLTHYHQRSNVETTFSMIKRKFGGSVRSKKLQSQFNEVLCKILAHNIVVLIHEMYELGIDPTFSESGDDNQRVLH